MQEKLKQLDSKRVGKKNTLPTTTNAVNDRYDTTLS